MKRMVFVLAAAALLLSACGTGGIEVRKPWARAAMMEGNSAVYFMLKNGTGAADELIGASSDAAEAVEVHLSSMTADGVMKMEKQEAVLLEAGAELDFAPGGLHVMLIGLTRDLEAGDKFQVTLHFRSHADIVIEVTVQEMEGMNMPGHAP